VSRGLVIGALLAAGRPVRPGELAKLLGLAEADISLTVAGVRGFLAEQSLGLDIEEVAGGFRLIVDRGLAGALSPVLGPPPLPSLTPAAIETLAVIAYRQPVTRGEVEAIRGSSCASTLITLQERELVKAIGRKEVVGRPVLYGTTERFLVEFGLRSLSDLPTLNGGDELFGFVRG
jgi:segregation and condensation protein B